MQALYLYEIIIDIFVYHSYVHLYNFIWDILMCKHMYKLKITLQ